MKNDEKTRNAGMKKERKNNASHNDETGDGEGGGGGGDNDPTSSKNRNKNRNKNKQLSS